MTPEQHGPALAFTLYFFLEGTDVAEVKAKHEALAKASQELGSALYAQQGGATGPAGGAAGGAGAGAAGGGAADDDVVDAEIVDEDK